MAIMDADEHEYSTICLLAGTIVTDARKRKGLKEGIPDLANYLDKL